MSIILIVAVLESHSAATEHSNTYIGGTLGMPVLLGIVLETEIDGSTRMGFNAGTMILANSLGVRIIRGATGPGWKFMYFAGAAAILNHHAEYTGDPKGISGHGWCGAGIDWNTEGWRLAIETGLLIGGSLEKGFGFTGLTPTWGISLLYGI